MNVYLSLFHEIVEIKVEEESVVRARAYIRLLLLGVKSPSSVSHMSTSYEKLFSRKKNGRKKHTKQMILNPILSRARLALAVANTINTR